MSRYLLIDIGAGTMDILYYDRNSDLQYKAVVKSPVQLVAEQAAQIKGDIAATGCEMGGGPITRVLKDRAINDRVAMSPQAAATLHHDLNKVKSWGIRIVEDINMTAHFQNRPFTELILQDLDLDRIETIVSGFGVPFSFDVMGICVQDHGIPPKGESHLDFRHNMFTAVLDKAPFPDALLYKQEQVPDSMGRLSAVAKSAASFPANEIYLMDSGMAAILGATMDPMVRNQHTKLLLDVATSHTIGAVIEKDEIAGFFEYHTSDITPERLEELIKGLADGRLTHEKILNEGGHGAYIRKAVGFDSVESILATGPKRKLVSGIRLPILYGAPLGDNMMTGTVGLLEAIRKRKKLDPIFYH